MFHRSKNRKAKPSHTKALKDLMAIETPMQLLADKKRQELLNRIKQVSSFEENRFASLSLSLLHNFINHCQNLPETVNSYYSLPGGMLDYALNRTEASLQLFRTYVLQEGADLSEEQKLWLYALFSSALLKGIGKLQIDYQVELFDINGQRLKIWNPVLESLSSHGSYYHYSFENGQDNDFRCRLNLLIARMMMPQSGFSWIASNPEVLAAWLALLNEDWQSAGTLGAILVHADAIAIQRFFTEFMLKGQLGRTGRTARISTFIDASLDPQPASKEQLIGAAFIQWLMQALEEGQIMINQSPLFMVPGGMLMSTDIFKWFVRENPSYKNWQAVQNGFLALGLHGLNSDGNIVSRFEQNHTQQVISGVVFSNYAVALPGEVSYRNLNTGKVSTLSATELIHSARLNANFTQHAASHSSPLKHLNANGEWQAADAVNASLTAGTGPYG